MNILSQSNRVIPRSDRRFECEAINSHLRTCEYFCGGQWTADPDLADTFRMPESGEA